MCTEIEQLYEFVRGFDCYPRGMTRISGEYPDNLFFPGGPGGYEEDGKISDKPIMVLGDQFTRQLDFNKTHGLRQQRTRMTPGYHTLLKFMVEAGVDPLHCFFTNAYPGMSLKPIRRSFRRSRDEVYYLEHTRDLFRKELEMQHPRLILVLGLRTAHFLAPFHPHLAPWAKATTFEELDHNRQAIITDVPLTGPNTTSLVLLVHPVGRQANIGRRRYGKRKGNAAECQMVKDVNRF